MRVSPQVKVRPRPDVTSGYAKSASDQEAMYLSALREALGDGTDREFVACLRCDVEKKERV